MNAEQCFKSMAQDLANTQNLIVVAPLSPGERAKLASLIAAFHYSNAVNLCVSANAQPHMVDLEDILNALTALVNETARHRRKPVILNS